MSEKHKLQGRDWRSTIFRILTTGDTLDRVVVEIDDGFIDIEDINDDTGEIISCTHRDARGNNFTLVGVADPLSANEPRIRLATQVDPTEPVLPRYGGRLIFESTVMGKTLKIIAGATLHDDGQRTDQQQDTWIAVKQG